MLAEFVIIIIYTQCFLLQVYMYILFVCYNIVIVCSFILRASYYYLAIYTFIFILFFTTSKILIIVYVITIITVLHSRLLLDLQ